MGCSSSRSVGRAFDTHRSSAESVTHTLWSLAYAVTLLIVGSVLAPSLYAQVPFTEESFLRGVAQITLNGTDYGKGFALNDLDGDGDLDLLLTGRVDGAVTIYRNDGAGFYTDVTPGSGLPVNIGMNGVACADFDADGDLDVYLSGWHVPNMLLRNDGDLTFSDVTTPPLDNSGPTAGCAWGDVDGDGYLDLFVTNYASGESQLLKNAGGTGTFSILDYGIIPRSFPPFRGASSTTTATAISISTSVLIGGRLHPTSTASTETTGIPLSISHRALGLTSRSIRWASVSATLIVMVTLISTRSIPPWAGGTSCS